MREDVPVQRKDFLQDTPTVQPGSGKMSPHPTEGDKVERKGSRRAHIADRDPDGYVVKIVNIQERAICQELC